MTEHTWATASADGTIVRGRHELTTGPGIPVVRVIFMFASLVAAARKRGGAAEPAARAWRIRAAVDARLLVLVASCSWAQLVLRWSALPWMAVSVGHVTGLVLLGSARWPTTSAVWRYHGAEHVIASAYEAGTDLDDLSAVARNPRVSRYCGTNVIAPAVLLLPLSARLPLVLVPVTQLLGLAVITELIWLAVDHEGSVLARLLLAPGMAAQRRITTLEPGYPELSVARLALLACIAEHEASCRVNHDRPFSTRQREKSMASLPKCFKNLSACRYCRDTGRSSCQRQP